MRSPAGDLSYLIKPCLQLVYSVSCMKCLSLVNEQTIKSVRAGDKSG